MLSRRLAWLVLSLPTVALALIGTAGVRHLSEPPPPSSMADVTERIERTGITCGRTTTVQADESTVVCGDGAHAVFVTFRHRLPPAGASGSYVPLRSLGARPGELSGDRFGALGPYDTLARVQEELGGRLQRLSHGR